MELVKQKLRVNNAAIVRAFVWGIVAALTYYGVCASTASLTVAHVRPATALWGLALANPAVSFGNALGAFAWNLQQGKVGGLYLLQPILNACIVATVAYLYARSKKTVGGTLIALTVIGLAINAVVLLNNALLGTATPQLLFSLITRQGFAMTGGLLVILVNIIRKAVEKWQK